MKKNAVGWFEIYVDNMDRAKTFYEKVFNRTLSKLGNPEIEMWAFDGDMNRILANTKTINNRIDV